VSVLSSSEGLVTEYVTLAIILTGLFSHDGSAEQPIKWGWCGEEHKVGGEKKAKDRLL